MAISGSSRAFRQSITMSELHEVYKEVGNEKFGDVVGEIAPYFSTIDPQFIALRPGYCQIAVPNRKSIHDHLGSVHVIAMCNGAELVAGLMIDASIPDSRRWIPIGMTVKYITLAKSDLIVTADGSDIDWQSTGEISVDVNVDCDDQAVMQATITMLVSEKDRTD